tara:strand:+ start:83 stop:367 length:285 start_codon:yes stop_codon:yes gene_type:complete
MVVGQLVRENCGDEVRAEIGTIVKVTPYQLANDDWKKDVRDTHPDEIHATIRPGFVVSVRWQKDATLMTTHVFYEGIENSVIDLGNRDSILIVK